MLRTLSPVNGDLSEVLTLLHNSARRWRTLRAVGEEWRDEDHSLGAFVRRLPPGGIMSMRGAPGPANRDPRWQMWIRRPDQARVEFGGAHQTRSIQITNRPRMWVALPNGQSHVDERRGGGRPELGPPGVLVETSSISAALDLGVVERTRMLGREAWAVRARPGEEDLRRQPGLLNPLVRGADDVKLVVDAERGVLLRLEAFLGGAPFYRVEMTEVAFDEDIADDVFAFPEGASA